MPRGRPQRKGTRQRYKPTDRRPRETVTRATDDAGSGMTPMSTDEWPALPHPRRSTAMASRWDEGNAGNWSAVVLRQKIEARGLKLPASMKKAQMLNIFLDNFNDEDQAASSSSTTGTTSDPPVSPEAVLPPEPEPQPCSPEPQPRSPEAAPEPPRSRWSVAANLNSIATRARQVHQRAGSLQLQGNVHFDETGTTGRRRVPQASERTTTPPQVDTPYVPSGALGDRSAEPLADVVYALQQSVSAMANQMREFLGAGAERTDSRPTASASNSTVTSYPTVTPSTSAAPADEPELTPMRSSRVGCGTVTTYNLTTAMEDIERSTRTSLRATSAFVDTTRWQQRTTAGYASESLPEVETVSPALRSAILDGKDVNLACLLIPHFDLGDYSRYAGLDGCQQLLRPLSSDPRLNRNLTLSEFVTAFNKYRNIMCEVWQRRKELDAYEAIVVGIASRIDGTAYYEYHKSFSARASALIQQQNVKVDWGVRDNGLFCSLFVGQRANVCSLCGSVAHLSGFCPTLVTPKTHNANTSHHFPGRSNFSSKGGPAAPTTDSMGRPRVRVGQTEVCNNFNSDRGCPRPDCRFLHSCLACRGPHSNITCPTMTGNRTEGNRHRAKTTQSTPRPTQ